MKMYLGGEWVDRDDRSHVLNPFDGSVVDYVPRASLADVETAIASAARGAGVMADLPAHERYRILHRAAELMEERVEDLGRTITLEEGKIIGEGMGEAHRSIETMTLSAEEAKRLYGENLPLDAAPEVS